MKNDHKNKKQMINSLTRPKRKNNDSSEREKAKKKISFQKISEICNIYGSKNSSRNAIV